MTQPRDRGRFLPGNVYSPATRFAPGHTLGVRTRFKPGQAAHNKLPIGAVRVRREANTGLLRAWVKTAEPNVWRKRAVVVWESESGRRLPRGSVVHHRDRNSLNDDPSNLVALSRSEHTAEHRAELVTGAWRALR